MHQSVLAEPHLKLRPLLPFCSFSWGAYQGKSSCPLPIMANEQRDVGRLSSSFESETRHRGADVDGSGSDNPAALMTSITVPASLHIRLLECARRCGGLPISGFIERLLNRYHIAALPFLPTELLILIFSFLPARAIEARIGVVSKLFRSIVKSSCLRDLLEVCGVYDQGQQILGFRNNWSTTSPESAPSNEGIITARVSFAAYTVYDRKIFRFGGRLESGERLNTCEFYDPLVRGGRWTSLPPLREVRSACGVGVVRGKAYIIGGCDDNGELASYEVFDLLRHEWIGEQHPMPVGICEHSVAVHNGTIYIVGGCQNRFKAEEMTTNEVLVFRPETGEWAALPPLPAPRRLSTAIAVPLSTSSASLCHADEAVAVLLVAGGFAYLSSVAADPVASIMSIRVRGMSYVPLAHHGATIWSKAMAFPVASAVVVPTSSEGRRQNLVVINAKAKSIETVSLDVWRVRENPTGSAWEWERIRVLPLEHDAFHCLLALE